MSCQMSKNTNYPDLVLWCSAFEGQKQHGLSPKNNTSCTCVRKGHFAQTDISSCSTSSPHREGHFKGQLVILMVCNSEGKRVSSVMFL